MTQKLSTLDIEFSHKIKEQAEAKKKVTKALISKLKRKKPARLDDEVREIHNEVFENTDCLSCANCCKTTSPIFYENDVNRLSRRLKIKSSEFFETYLKIDEDKDMVLKSSPCPFLLADNTCFVYEDRPQACRQYPHTDRKRFYQVLDLTYRNSFICPAVQNILTEISKKYL